MNFDIYYPNLSLLSASKGLKITRSGTYKGTISRKKEPLTERLKTLLSIKRGAVAKMQRSRGCKVRSAY